ncbi:MAG: VWA domain-containing protein [Deltaproteobacteria bacterium]|nr:VWA domain-containing protein [Deltaproteobacteria bacterium]
MKETRYVLLLVVVVGWALLVAGCTDVKLRRLERAPSNRVSVGGELCTGRPDEAKYPVRILFAVDSSDSMLFNDPNNRVVDAIETVVREYRDSDNVSFGIVRWGEQVVRELIDFDGGEPTLFTKDEQALGRAFARMRQRSIDNPLRYLGGTNYGLALGAVRDYVLQDLAMNPDAVGLHQYYVEFVTDGMPQSEDREPANTRRDILLLVDALRIEFALRFDAISIVELAIVAPEFFDLLPAMVLEGGGAYVQLSSPEALVSKLQQIGFSDRVLLEFELSTLAPSEDVADLIVVNPNMRIAEVGGVVDLFLDSDGDGLVDAFEAELGTSPSHTDTDGDGLSDLFEYRFLGEFDPRAQMSQSLSIEERGDPDRDGLITFEEQRLGTDPGVPDTDGDGLPDGLELREGSDPRSNDLGADPDHDGLSVAFEIRQHTHPGLDEGEDLRAAISYAHEPVGAPTRIVDGRRCYDFRVDNISLGETEPSVDADGVARPAGFNRLELWRMERPIASKLHARLTSIRRMVRGGKWALFRPSEGVRDPAALEIHVEEGDFDP